MVDPQTVCAGFVTGLVESGPVGQGLSMDSAPSSVGAMLARRAELTPTEVVVRCAGETLTAAELDERATQVARGLLSMGLNPGDRVAVLLPNTLEFVELIFACSRAGLVQVPLNAYLKGDFLRHQLADSGAALLVTDADGEALATPLMEVTGVRQIVRIDRDYQALRQPAGDIALPAVGPTDLAVLMYTSGTTGMPKACMLSHAYQLTIARAYHKAGWVSDGERVFTALPLYHAGGQLAALITAIYAGGRITFPARFSASNFMADAAADGATLVFGVMAMASAILAADPANDPAPGAVDKAIWIPLDAAGQQSFAERFGCRVTAEGYGQSEATAICLNPFETKEHRPGTLGRPTDIVEVLVVDDEDVEVAEGEIGEIVVRPRVPGAIFSGYWNNPQATLTAFRNLWYHTGDYGRRLPDGSLVFVDRKKDAVRRRGENVSSIELERAILAHPAVAEVAVHAVASELGEDDIKACLVVTAEPPELGELFAFFRDNLPYFAVPRYIEFLDSLPKNGMGRVLKHKLRANGVSGATIDLQARGFTVSTQERRR